MALALEAAAQRGVAVFVRLDGFGSADFPLAWRRRLERAGVVLHMFNPPRWYSWVYVHYWRRLHRKLAVVDARVAFCGGMNIIDDYYDEHIGDLSSPRVDFTVCVRGPLVQDVRALMWGARAERPVADDATLRLEMPEEGDARADSSADAGADRAADVRAAFVVRDNVRYRRRIESVYLRAIARAARV